MTKHISFLVLCDNPVSVLLCSVCSSANKNIARIANAVPFTLYSRVTMNDEIVVLNCQKCNQCLTYHKSSKKSPKEVQKKFQKK